jgi:hypothetical protein
LVIYSTEMVRAVITIVGTLEYSLQNGLKFIVPSHSGEPAAVREALPDFSGLRYDDPAYRRAAAEFLALQRKEPQKVRLEGGSVRLG